MLLNQYRRTVKWLVVIAFLLILVGYFCFDNKTFGELVFSNSLNNNGIVSTINADGSGASNLTSVKASLQNPFLILQRLEILDYKQLPPLLKFSSDIDAQWSPDGSFVAYRSYAGDTSDETNIYLLKPHTAARQLTHNIDVWSFVWLNKNSILLEDETGKVYALDTESAHISPVQCLHNGFMDVSPDGSQIIAAQRSPDEIAGMPTQLVVVSLDCSKTTVIIEHPFGICDAVWSPNGQEVAVVKGNYVTIDYQGENLRRYECNQVYRVQIDGSATVRLDDNDYLSKYDLAWSPDGTQIAFAAFEQYVQDIYLMNRDGSNLIRVTNSLAYDEHPVWSPTGDEIAFGYTDNVTNQRGIFIYRLADSKLNAIAIDQYGGGSISWRPPQK